MKGVIANSFPKSGTHILTRILDLMNFKAGNSHFSRSLLVYGHRNFIRNWKIYRRLEGEYNRGLNIDLEVPDRKIKNEWLLKHMRHHLHHKMYVQAHLPYSVVLDEAIRNSNIPMLYIHREPKDALVSLKNYILKKTNHPNHKMLNSIGSNEEKLMLLIRGYNGGSNISTMAPFCEKYCRSISWTKSEHGCSISFENIIGEQGGGNNDVQKNELKKIFDYLGTKEIGVEDIQQQIYYKESDTFHKGKIGQWENEFSPLVSESFEKYMKSAQLKYT